MRPGNCFYEHAVGPQEQRELTKQFSSGHHHERGEPPAPLHDNAAAQDLGRPASSLSTSTTLSRFMPTSRRIVQFSDNVPPPPGSTIVYIDGAFDLFHPGHVQILQVFLSACLMGGCLVAYPVQLSGCCQMRAANLPSCLAWQRQWWCRELLSNPSSLLHLLHAARTRRQQSFAGQTYITVWTVFEKRHPALL